MKDELRPMEVRQLDALTDWFDTSPWSIREAACLLAGVLPRQRTGDERIFGEWLPGSEPWEGGPEAWLPGREPWEATPEAWLQIVTDEIYHIETVLRDDKRVLNNTPEDFLLLASRLGVLPPWAECVLDSKTHSAFLSLKVRSALREALGKTIETNLAANRSFGARAKNWDEAVIRATELRDFGMKPDQIANTLSIEGFCWDRKELKPFGAPAIRRWFRQMKGDPSYGIPPQTALEYTETFRKWRDG